MPRLVIWFSLIAGLSFGAPAAQEQSISAPASDGSLTIRSALPIEQAVGILADRYGVPITLDEPKWLWNGDLLIGTMARQDRPKFAFPGGLYPELNPAAEVALKKLVKAFNDQSNGVRFRVQKSPQGLHVVPDRIHGANGALEPASSALDVPINVPVRARLASEHLKAIRDAVNQIAGIRLLISTPFGGLDPLFAANGIIAPRDAEMRPAPEREIYSFGWGESGTTARDALSALLQLSATTLRWNMLCDPAAAGEPRFCVLNLLPLKRRIETGNGNLRPGTDWLVFDKAAKPPVPAPPREAPAAPDASEHR